MRAARIASLIGKDLRMGPRSPIVVFALLMPILITFLLQVVLVTLFDPKPRLGVVDYGASQITAELLQMEEIDTVVVGSAAELRQLVESNDIDAGLVLAAGFDEAVYGGERPLLELVVSGECLLVDRVVLAVTAIDLVREVDARPPPVEVELVTVGAGEALPISDLLVLGVILFVMLMVCMFVPAFLLVEERERQTLDGILVTPATMSEVLVSKAGLGFLAATIMCYLTLALNGALSAEPLALTAVVAVGVLTCNEIGLLYGTTAKDAKSLYTLTKSLNIFLLGPLFFYFCPSWPQWIAKVFPTYWFIDPLYQIGLRGASLGDVWPQLVVSLGICAALLVPIFYLGRRMQAKLAAS